MAMVNNHDNHDNHSNNSKHTTSPPLNLDEMTESYSKSKKRMFFMDYDGTLSPIVSNPADALPSEELKETLKKLTNDKRNNIYIISGRDRKALTQWLGDLRVGMSTEHGCLLRPLTHPDSDHTDSLPTVENWKDLAKEKGIDVSWKAKIVDVFNSYIKKIEGSTVETKEYAVTFHYRNSNNVDPALKQELKKELTELEKQYSTLSILKGKKSLEARITGINKGWVVKQILDVSKRDGVSFVFCAGDDLTDEDMFTELQKDKTLNDGGLYTVTVNFKGSKAKFSVANQKEILKALGKLASISADDS